MGNYQTEKPFQVRAKLLSTSLLKTLTFSTRQSLNLYVHQLRSRMTLRSYSLPRIVYFNQITSPTSLSCQTSPSLKLEVYFQDFGKAYSEQCVIIEQCRCMELLDAIEQLKDRYGYFNVSLSSIFVKMQGKFRRIIVWIHNQVQQCKPSNKCDEKSMCQSILNAIPILMKGKCSQNYQRLSMQKHQLIKFSMLKQEIIKCHTLKVNLIKQNIRQDEHLFTFKYIKNQANQSIPLPPKMQQINIPPNKPTSPQPQRIQQKIQQVLLPILETTFTDKNQTKIIEATTNNQKIPPLNMKSLYLQISDENRQSQRTILSRNESIQQIKQLYNEQKQYQDLVTTARSPGRNYIMRKSDQLTIFPNQYQIKFQTKHKINCQAQIKQSFLAFKKAMNTLKCQQSTQAKKKLQSPIQQKPFLQYR